MAAANVLRSYLTVKNSQVAVICAAILAAALINAVGNFFLLQSLRA